METYRMHLVSYKLFESRKSVSFKASQNHTECSKIEQRSVIRFLYDWDVKMMMFTENHVLIKQIFTNDLNMSLPLKTWIEQAVNGVETHWLFGKEKVKRVMHADSFMGLERTHDNWFPWKGCGYK